MRYKVIAFGMLMSINLLGKNIKLDETVINSSSFGTNVFETPKNVTVITTYEILNGGGFNRSKIY